MRWWDYDDETLRRYTHLFGDANAFIEDFAKWRSCIETFEKRKISIGDQI